jgi:hypothetical protein
MDLRTSDGQLVQRQQALARANRIRQTRAKLKRRIADGEVSAADAILFHQRDVDGMRVADVLTSQPHWGDMRCRRVLTAMRLHERKTIGAMTDRQRLVLAARLTAPHGGRPRGVRPEVE